MSPSDAAIAELQESPWILLQVLTGLLVLLGMIGLGLRMLRAQRGKVF